VNNIPRKIKKKTWTYQLHGVRNFFLSLLFDEKIVSPQVLASWHVTVRFALTERSSGRYG
jgi:hypothetical protein